MSKNRIIVEYDSKKNVCAQVTSSTHDTKSRTSLIFKNQKVYMKHNSFSDEIINLLNKKWTRVENPSGSFFWYSHAGYPYFSNIFFSFSKHFLIIAQVDIGLLSKLGFEPTSLSIN